MSVISFIFLIGSNPYPMIGLLQQKENLSNAAGKYMDTIAKWMTEAQGDFLSTFFLSFKSHCTPKVSKMRTIVRRRRTEVNLVYLNSFFFVPYHLTDLADKLRDAKLEIKGMRFTLYFTVLFTIEFDARIEERAERRHPVVLDRRASCRCVFPYVFFLCPLHLLI